MALIRRVAGRRAEDDPAVAKARQRRQEVAGIDWDDGGTQRESGTLYCSDPSCQDGIDNPYFTVSDLSVDQWFTCIHCGSIASAVP